jgi:hypothetical protein
MLTGMSESSDEWSLKCLYFSVMHLSDDQLEEYILGRLCAAEARALAIHILTCPGCLSRLEALEVDLSVLKAALGHLRANSTRSDLQQSSPFILRSPARTTRKSANIHG